MVKKEEYKYLETEKIKSGKTKEQAYKEIRTLNQSQIEFTKLKRDLGKLQKALEKKDELIEKLQKSNFSLLPIAEEKITEVGNNGNKATIIDLNRVLNVINLEGKIGLSKIPLICGLKRRRCKEALNFLMRNNIIRGKKEGRTLYFEKVR